MKNSDTPFHSVHSLNTELEIEMCVFATVSICYGPAPFGDVSSPQSVPDSPMNKTIKALSTFFPLFRLPTSVFLNNLSNLAECTP